MTESQTPSQATPVAVATPAPAPAPPAPPGQSSRRGALIVAILILFSLAWYFIADRITPYSSQARIQAFIVPVAAEIAGKVSEVKVRNNDEVEPGAVMFVIDKVPYEIALQ